MLDNISFLPIISYTVLFFLIIYIYLELSNSIFSVFKIFCMSLIMAIIFYLYPFLNINDSILFQFLSKYLFLIIILLILNKNNIYQIIYYSTTINTLYFIIYVSIFYLGSFNISALFLNLELIDQIAIFGTIIIYLMFYNIKLIKFTITASKYDMYLTSVNLLSSMVIPCFFSINPNPATWSSYYFLMLIITYSIIVLCMFFLNKLTNITKKTIIDETLSRYKTAINVFTENINKEKQEARKLRHDIKKHLIIIKELLASNHLNEAINYLDKIQLSTSHNLNDYTGNIILDAYLSHIIINNQKINFKINAINFNNLDNNNLDFIILITNVIDNAVENISSPYYIQAFFRLEENMVTLKITNSTLNNPINTGFKSNKNTDNHGLGITIITDIVAKYNGNIIYSYENNLFTVYIELKI